MSFALVRAAALVAALVLALLARGDAIVLVALLAIGAWRPLSAVAVLTALAGSAWRWSSTALEDVAGAQGVLGPAGVVDPATAATGAWLGALALVVATPNLVEAWLFEQAELGRRANGTPRWQRRGLEWLPPLAFGACAASVVAGPASVPDLWIRALATVVAVTLASVVSRRRRVLKHPLVLDAAAAAVGLGSLVLVALDAPPVGHVLDTDALVEGLVMALAVALLVAAAVTALDHRAAHRDQPIGEGRR